MIMPHMCFNDSFFPTSTPSVFCPTASHKTSLMFLIGRMPLYVFLAQTHSMLLTAHWELEVVRIKFLPIWKPSLANVTLFAIEVGRGCEGLSSHFINGIRHRGNLMVVRQVLKGVHQWPCECGVMLRSPVTATVSDQSTWVVMSAVIASVLVSQCAVVVLMCRIMCSRRVARVTGVVMPMDFDIGKVTPMVRAMTATSFEWIATRDAVAHFG